MSSPHPTLHPTLRPTLRDSCAHADAARDALAYRIANETVVSEIEQNALAVQVDGERWFDLRPMQDPRECCPEVLDMHDAYIRHALEAGLLICKASAPHLVRIKR